MSRTPSSKPANALEVLIVDDDALHCERMEALLAAHGIPAISVDTLSMAREAMRAVYFPLIILDRHLRDGDGVDLCREYRARQTGRRVRILMLSASDSAEEARKATAAGADEFLSKRAGDATLMTKVAELYALASGKNALMQGNQAEAAHVRALSEVGISDRTPEQVYADITRLASIVCKAPIAFISMTNETRQLARSLFEMDIDGKGSDDPFCAHAIARPSEVFVVEDTLNDARFAHAPMVAGKPHARFYAGAPLVTARGTALGVLCVMDRVPRQLEPEAIEGLRTLARQVILLVQQRLNRKELERASIAQRAIEADLRRSEALFRTAYENAPIGIALVSVKGEWLRVNQALCRILGYSADELLRTTFQAITHPEDLEVDLGHVREMLDGTIHAYEMKKRYVHKQGHYITALLGVSLVRDEQGQPLHFVSQIQEIPAPKADA
jgi:PAS domain S-box-containing protein